MKLHLLAQCAYTTTPYLGSIRGLSSLSPCSSLQREGGVSMVQGASRGIGLEFVKQLLEKNSKEHVVATCRDPNTATGLIELKNNFSERLHIQRLDLTNESTIEESAKAIGERYGSLNLLINASGILSILDVLQPVQKQH